MFGGFGAKAGSGSRGRDGAFGKERNRGLRVADDGVEGATAKSNRESNCKSNGNGNSKSKSKSNCNGKINYNCNGKIQGSFAALRMTA